MSADRIVALAPLTVIELSLPDVITAAAEAGYRHAGLRLVHPTMPADAPSALTDASLRSEIARRSRATGVSVFDVELVRLTPGDDGASWEPLIATGAALGASRVVAAGEDPDEDALAGSFGALCDLAQRYGLAVGLEFMPWTALATLAAARRIVEAAGRPNGGILVDAIHLARSGESVADLAACPSGQLSWFQICDGPAERPVDMAGLLHQGRAARLPPGEGAFDIAGMLAAMPADLPVSVEVPMRELAKTVPAARRAATLLAATMPYLAASR